VGHPFDAGIALGLIGWFVVAVFARNKARMGDVLYPVGPCADSAIRNDLQRTNTEKAGW
jgi:hypothetical protein